MQEKIWNINKWPGGDQLRAVDEIIETYGTQTSYENLIEVPFIYKGFKSYIYFKKTQHKNFQNVIVKLFDCAFCLLTEQNNGDFSAVIKTLSATECEKNGEWTLNLFMSFFCKIGVSIVKLQDASQFTCDGLNDKKYTIPLWLYYILKYGYTWYEKHGFEPDLPKNVSSNEWKNHISNVRSKPLIEVFGVDFIDHFQNLNISPQDSVASLFKNLSPRNPEHCNLLATLLQQDSITKVYADEGVQYVNQNRHTMRREPCKLFNSNIENGIKKNP